MPSLGEWINYMWDGCTMESYPPLSITEWTRIHTIK